MSKKVVLKNNQVADLIYSRNLVEYCIIAQDENKQIVASCTFSIIRYYTSQLSDNERELYAKNHNIPIDSAPKEIEKTIYNTLDPSFNNETILSSTGKEFRYRETVCKLNKIEINDARYINIGLGSKMLELVERIADKYNAKRIRALYYPIGAFKEYTYDFYVRNGFSFELVNKCETLAVKELGLRHIIDND